MAPACCPQLAGSFSPASIGVVHGKRCAQRQSRSGISILARSSHRRDFVRRRRPAIHRDRVWSKRVCVCASRCAGNRKNIMEKTISAHGADLHVRWRVAVRAAPRRAGPPTGDPRIRFQGQPAAIEEGRGNLQQEMYGVPRTRRRGWRNGARARTRRAAKRDCETRRKFSTSSRTASRQPACRLRRI